MAESTAAAPRRDESNELGAIRAHLELQSNQIAKLQRELVSAPGGGEAHSAPPRQQDQRGAELPYRFDASPKWLEASGFKEQSVAHRKAWPALRRLLELEQWTGAPIQFTFPQLADYLCVSEDTAKRHLRRLVEWGVLEYAAGGGRRPSTVKVLHPIQTPIPYAEVPWAAGGLAGAPEGYVEGLTGAKRHYAELYGAAVGREGVEVPKQPEASTEPDTGGPEPKQVAGHSSLGAAAPEPEIVPESPSGPDEPRVDAPEGEGVQVASPGGAVCPPLETEESNVIPYSSSPPDTGARARPDGEEEKKEGTRRLISQTEARLKAIPPEQVGEEAGYEARLLVEALGAYDARTATRAGQLAALALYEDEGGYLREACRRIRSARKRSKVRIAVPTRYAISVYLQVREELSLSGEEAGLARRVLSSAKETHKGTQRAEKQSGGEGRTTTGEEQSFRAGYEWFFQSRVSGGGGAAAGQSADAEEQASVEESRTEEGGEDRPYPRHERERRRRREEEVAELLERGGDDGERIRRLALRVREGRLSEEVLAERVAEVLEGGSGSGGRYRRAVADVLAHGTRPPGDEREGDAEDKEAGTTSRHEFGGGRGWFCGWFE